MSSCAETMRTKAQVHELLRGLGWAAEPIIDLGDICTWRSSWRNESATRTAHSLNRPTQASLKTMMLPE